MHTLTLELPASTSASRVERLDRVAILFKQGLLLQAHELAQALGDYRSWRTATELAMAVSLVGHLGAPRLSDALAIRCYRRHRDAAEAKLVYGRYLLSRRGHYRAWLFWREQADWQAPTAELQAEWLGFGARLFAMLRDFDTSAALLARMAELRVEDPWLAVERSVCLDLEDRHEEALVVCQQVLAGYPGYRAAIQLAARLELLLNRGAQALARLRDAAGRLESASLCAQLSEQLIEVGELDEAESWLMREQLLTPLREPQMARWSAGRRCDIACLRGDYAQARIWAEQAGPGFYAAVHERLQTPTGVRRLLPVEFVRQHHMTCAPATLSALSAYWGRAVAHLEIAEEICYDGTTHQAERAWAERNGWLATEFTVDWPTARALIDRGIPFTLTVQYTGSGHLQAVVGYDEPRGTLLIRDPAQPQHGESLAEALIKDQAASGPRGMLLLPIEEAARLEGLVLPESDRWALYHRCLGALDGHRRDQAHDCLKQLQQLDPTHRLSLQARRALAWYDGDEARALEATEALLGLYPHDSNLILSKASSLAVLRPRHEQLDWLERHSRVQRGDPAVLQRHAQLLSEDGRMTVTVAALLQRSLSYSPLQAQAWNALASLRWEQGAREEATLLYRIAACLQGVHEGFCAQYFRSLRCLGRTEEGLAFLRARQRRLGAYAAGPSLTLAEFLEEQEEPLLVRELLESALVLRPEDGELALALVDFYGRIGEHGPAQRLLQECEARCRRSAWLRTAVLLSQRSAGDPQQALAWCREAVAQDPLNLSLQRMCLSLLDQVEGAAVADGHVAAQVARFPHHRGLLELQVERAQRQSPQAAEQALRGLLASHPLYAWAVRELAVCLARLGQREEALALSRQAIEIDPASSSSHSTAGFVLLQAGRREAALEAFTQALRLSVDNDYASAMLLDNAADHAQALEFCESIHRELVRQVTFGDGWLAYQQQAQGLLGDEQLLQRLRQALEQRSDLWQTWVAVARQLVQCGQEEQAESLLMAARERFPLLPRMAYEWALLLRQRGELERCLETLEQSFVINALWGMSVRLYVDVLLELGGRLEQAEQVLRQVLRRTPDNGELRAYLAYVLGERSSFGEALEQAERVLRMEPDNAWAWGQLGRYSAQLGDQEYALRLARELVRLRTGDVDAWLALAEQEQDEEPREAALRQALQLNPRHRLANERLLELLLQAGRFEALRDLLARPCWDGVPPAELALFHARATQAEGDNALAQEQLQRLLDGQPNCFVAWRLLADWREVSEDFEGYMQAAREMVRLEPRNAMAQGYLGHALLLNGDREQALPCFESAARLDAGYLFAHANAYDLRFERGEHDQARLRLEAMLERFPQSSLWLRALRLAQVQGDDGLRERALDALMTQPDAEDSWQEVLQLLDQRASDRALQARLSSHALAGRLHSAAARHWLELEAQSWRPGALWRAFERALPQDAQHSLKQAMLNLLAERQSGRSLLPRVLRRCRAAVASDDRLWATASYAMLSHELCFMMRAWLPSWRERAVPVWGLDNLAVALRSLGRDAEAAEVSAASLDREPANRDAMLWLAVDAALRGDRQGLEEWLARSGDEPLRPFFQCLRHLLDGWLTACRAGDSRQALAHFERAKVAAGDAHSVYRRVRKRLSRDLCRTPLTPAWLRPWRYWQLRF